MRPATLILLLTPALVAASPFTPQPKLDTQLLRLITPDATAARRSPTFLPSTHLWERDGRVHVRVTTDDPDSPALRAAGLDPRHVGRDHVEGWLPTANLQALGDLAAVRSVRPVLPGRLRATADVASRADLARATGFTGAGVTVGVISDGAGSLPASFVPAGCAAGSGAEGQALIQVVQALAPGARLLFSEGLSSSQAFIDSIGCLRAAGASVIVDDLGFYDQPFFQDGSVAVAVQAAVAAGISFHSAAGNDGQDHYGATFLPDGDGYHQFAPGDRFDDVTVSAGQTLDCVLQWDDPFGASGNDYDLEVWDMDGAAPVLAASSNNPQTGAGDPIEMLSVVNSGRGIGRAGVAIRRVHGDVRTLKLFCFAARTLEYLTPAGSIVGHPGVPGVVAVAAIDVGSSGLDTVEPFSSQGPVAIEFPVPETRAKPDLAGYDGVTTTVAGFNPFFGTSAAAPDSAAVAALLLEKNGCLTPDQVRATLVGTAIDVGVPGFDTVSGAGRLDALAAIQATTAPACDDGDACTGDACVAGRGCVSTPLAGIDGLSCVCADGLVPAACSTLPRGLASRLGRACRLTTRAASATGARRTRTLVQQIVQVLGRATHAAARGNLDDACASALATRLSDAHTRAVALRRSL